MDKKFSYFVEKVKYRNFVCIVENLKNRGNISNVLRNLILRVYSYFLEFHAHKNLENKITIKKDKENSYSKFEMILICISIF